MNRTLLVQHAAQILINVPPNELDQVLAEIKKVHVVNYLVWTAEELSAIANEQIARLRERLGKLVTKGEVTQEQVDAIVACLESKREAAIAKAMGVPIIYTHLPLLAAISKEHLTCTIQMPMVKLGEDTGTNHLNDDEFTNKVELPKGIAWWLTDVEDGQQFCTNETSSEDEENIIEEQGRLRVIATGAIALGIQTDVLARHNVVAPGSRFRNYGTPDLFSFAGEPGLGCSNVGREPARWGSASCSNYI